MKNINDSNQSGFTLIELLIATTVFSIILLVASATLIQIGRLYYKGVITSKTQNIARTTIDDVSRSIQFSSGNLQTAAEGSNPKLEAYCIGNTRYTYVDNAQVSESATNYDAATGKIRYALWQDTIGAEQCGSNLPKLQLTDPYSGAGSTRNGRPLLENDMRLQDFKIEALDNDVFKVHVNVIFYADGDLLNDFNNPTACKSSVVGGQWCAISDLSSVVYSRSK